jgi:LmbE family N-acetylglucosaminyl deacetylase
MFGLAELLHVADALIFLSVCAYITIKSLPLRRSVRKARLIFNLMLACNLFFAGLQLYSLAFTDPVSWHHLGLDFVGILGQSLLLISVVQMKMIAKPSSKHLRVLVVGAHPDDIEIACGGTLAKLHDEGHTIWGLVVTRGEMGGDPESRQREAIMGAKFLGLDEMRILDYPDTRLSGFTLEIAKEIESVIQELHPDVIFTHSGHDLHQDHQSVHDATLRASRNLNTILCYESPSTTQAFQPNFFIDIQGYEDIKIDGIREHRGQRTRSYTQSDRVDGIALFRGSQAKLKRAEGFEAIRMTWESYLPRASTRASVRSEIREDSREPIAPADLIKTIGYKQARNSNCIETMN